MTKTKIIATIGPACRNPKTIEKMILAGMDIVRINCSHASHDDIRDIINDVRSVSQKFDNPIGILLDLSGPKIRTGNLVDNEPVELISGSQFTLTGLDILGNKDIVGTNYTNLAQEVKVNDKILLDDGLIELKVTQIENLDVICEIITGGILKNHQGINLPGVKLQIPALTDKDKADLLFALNYEIDFVALSFVRDSADITYLKNIIGNHYPPIMVIAKLEKPEAIECLDDIMDVSDGVMVARGDLGVELPPEKVPPVQKLIIQKANQKGIPVITATQMLDSMANNPRPTRAEASDVANAIFDGTDAVMLSEETATGHYPVEAVAMMDRIAHEAESTINFNQLQVHELPTQAHAIAHAACNMAVDMQAKLIATFTKTGSTARLISKFRPPNTIIALTQHLHVFRQLSILWGVNPLMLTQVSDSETTLAMVEHTLLKRGLVVSGDAIVITGGLPIAARGPANFVKVSTITNRPVASHIEFKGI